MDRCLRLMNMTGVWAVFFQMCIISADVILRFTIHRALVGVDEVAGFAMIIAVCFCMGYAQRTKAHVSVEILYSKLPLRVQKILDVFSNGLGAIVCALIITQCIESAFKMKALQKYSDVLKIPVYPMYLLIAAGIAGFFAQLLVDVKTSLTDLMHVLKRSINR